MAITDSRKDLVSVTSESPPGGVGVGGDVGVQGVQGGGGGEANLWTKHTPKEQKLLLVAAIPTILSLVLIICLLSVISSNVNQDKSVQHSHQHAALLGGEDVCLTEGCVGRLSIYSALACP